MTKGMPSRDVGASSEGPAAKGRGGPTAVALLAWGGRDTAVLEFAFRRFLGGEFEIVAPELGEVVLIDGDAPNAKSGLQNWRSGNAAGPVVLFALHPAEWAVERVTALAKPIDVQALIACLRQLRKELDSPRRVAPPRVPEAPAAASPAAVAAAERRVAAMDDEGELDSYNRCGIADDFPPEQLQAWERLSPDQGIQLYFDPDERLLGFLRRAAQLAQASGKAACISGLARPIVVLPGANTRVLSPVKDIFLRPLSTTTLFSASIAISETPPVEDGDFSYDLDVLLWKVTLWSARGRLPRDTDPHAPVRLRRAPDYSRLTRTPYADDICRLWLAGSGLGPAATATHLGIAQRYVFALYSAARILDLVEVAAGADAARSIDFARTPLNAARPKFVVPGSEPAAG